MVYKTIAGQVAVAVMYEYYCKYRITATMLDKRQLQESPRNGVSEINVTESIIGPLPLSYTVQNIAGRILLFRFYNWSIGNTVYNNSKTSKNYQLLKSKGASLSKHYVKFTRSHGHPYWALKCVLCHAL